MRFDPQMLLHELYRWVSAVWVFVLGGGCLVGVLLVGCVPQQHLKACVTQSGSVCIRHGKSAQTAAEGKTLTQERLEQCTSESDGQGRCTCQHGLVQESIDTAHIVSISCLSHHTVVL
jgi:hypothetical protein